MTDERAALVDGIRAIASRILRDPYTVTQRALDGSALVDIAAALTREAEPQPTIAVADNGQVSEQSIAEAEPQEPPHVCGLQGFGALGDSCEGCTHDRAVAEAKRRSTAEATPRDTRDAARYRFLRDLKCSSVIVDHDNAQAPNYRTAREWIEEDSPEWYADVPADELERMKAANSIWCVQIYPNTPVGFNTYHGATLDAAIDSAMADYGCAAMASPAAQQEEGER